MKWSRAIPVLAVAGCSAESDVTTEGDITTNSIGMKLKRIPAGTFMMGSEDGDDDEKPVHQVTLTQSFLLGVYEVTQTQYKRVTGSLCSVQPAQQVAPAAEARRSRKAEPLRRLNFIGALGTKQ